MRADVSDPEALQALGGRNLDGAVVAVSESSGGEHHGHDDLSKEMGIPYVLAKAKDEAARARFSRRSGRMPSPIRSGRWENGWQKSCIWYVLWTRIELVLRIQYGRSGDPGKMGRKKPFSELKIRETVRNQCSWNYSR